MLWQARDIAFGQPLKFPQQLLLLVHRIKAPHPKHDFHLHFDTLPNGLSLGSTSPLYFMMTAPSMIVASPLCSASLIQIHGLIAYSRQDFFPWKKKVYPWGVPPIVSFPPRDASPPISSLGGLSKTLGAFYSFFHSTLSSLASHYAANVGKARVDDCALFGSVGPPQIRVAPSPSKGVFDRALQEMQHSETGQFGQDAALGPSGCPDFGSWNASPSNGW